MTATKPRRVYVTVGTFDENRDASMRAELATSEPEYLEGDTFRLASPTTLNNGDSLFVMWSVGLAGGAGVEVVGDTENEVYESTAEWVRQAWHEGLGEMPDSAADVVHRYFDHLGGKVYVQKVVVGGETVVFGDETWTVYTSGDRVMVRNDEGVFPLDAGATPDDADNLAAALRRVAAAARKNL